MDLIEERARECFACAVEARHGEILRFLQSYIKHPSINVSRCLPSDDSGGVNVCQQWLANQMRSFNCFSEVDMWEAQPGAPNVVATLGRFSRAGRTVMFSGHTDVVPVTKPQSDSWNSPGPWSGAIEEGRVWGRGSSDMKGGVAAFVIAARILADSGIRLKGGVVLGVDSTEESAGHQAGCLSILERIGQPDLIINAEPTLLKICPAALGWLYFRLVVKGKSIHPAYVARCIYPSGYGIEVAGVNAISKMFRYSEALENLNRDWGLHQKHRLMPSGYMNLCLTKMNGGEYPSSVPSSCEAIWGVNFRPGLTGDDVIGEIMQVIHGVTDGDYWLRENPPEVDYPYLEPVFEPVDTDPESDGCHVLRMSFEQALSSKPILGCFPSASDASALAAKGIDTIICGPGDLSWGTHGANEFTTVEQVLNACKLYGFMMINWCGVDSIEGKEA